MQIRRTLALCGATVALVLVLAATSLAAGTDVSVRVEGKTRTLLATTVVHTHSGSITKGGTPAGACSATSAAGALDVATDHRWNAIYNANYGAPELTSILGETHQLTSIYYWSVWVNDRYAPAGICGLKLHRGEQLLFAAVPDKGSEYPIVITGPSHTSAGHPFELKVSYYNSHGVAKALAGARVRGAGLNAATDKHGVVSVVAQRKGTLKYTASELGYIRAQASVRVF